jgi:hypothetical protein
MCPVKRFWALWDNIYDYLYVCTTLDYLVILDGQLIVTTTQINLKWKTNYDISR